MEYSSREVQPCTPGARTVSRLLLLGSGVAHYGLPPASDTTNIVASKLKGVYATRYSALVQSHRTWTEPHSLQIAAVPRDRKALQSASNAHHRLDHTRVAESLGPPRSGLYGESPQRAGAESAEWPRRPRVIGEPGSGSPRWRCGSCSARKREGAASAEVGPEERCRHCWPHALQAVEVQL